MLQTFFGNVGFGKTALKVPYEKNLTSQIYLPSLKMLKKYVPGSAKKNLEKLALNVDKSSVCATEIPLSFFFHGFVDSLLYTTRLETLLKIVRYTMLVFVSFCPVLREFWQE